MKKVLFVCFISVSILLFVTGCDLLGNLFGDGGYITVESVPSNLMFVGESDREATTYSTRPSVDIWFPSPNDFGADSYTVQVSTNGKTTWSNFQYYGDDLVTNAEGTTCGFTVEPTVAPSWFRLLISGGTYDGQISDAMEVPILSEVDTRFSGWVLDYNATATQPPRVGYGISASCTVTEAESPYTAVAVSSLNLSYQWYRVNPNDYDDIELIAGATDAVYITTSADKGHQMMVRMTGDGVTIGGFVQAMAEDVVN